MNNTCAQKSGLLAFHEIAICLQLPVFASLQCSLSVYFFHVRALFRGGFCSADVLCSSSLI